MWEFFVYPLQGPAHEACLSEFPFSHLQDVNDNDFSSQGHEMHNSDDACESELGLE